MPSGCPPIFSNNSKNLVELEEPCDLDLREFPTTRGDSSNPFPRKHSKRSLWILPEVPLRFFGRDPPFPACKKTVDGRAFLCFFSKIYAFSNHYPAQFHLSEGHFCCSEQYYMWQKSKYFGFDNTADEIMENSQAHKIKRLGHADTLRERRRMGMEPNSREFDHDEWRGAKEEIMLIALRAKFLQNPSLGKMLRETEDALLVEASPSDKYWGIGSSMDNEQIEDPAKWQGLNRMGILLQRLRQEIRWGGEKEGRPTERGRRNKSDQKSLNF